MARFNLLFFTLLLVSQCFAADACTNFYFDVSELKNDNADYVTPTFKFDNKSWKIAFNFCRNTVGSCLYQHLAAYMYDPSNPSTCSASLAIGDYYEAQYGASIYLNSKN